jgi:hypothetical protein
MHRIHITLSSKPSTTFPIPPSYGNDKNPHGEGGVGETSSRELNQSNPIQSIQQFIVSVTVGSNRGTTQYTQTQEAKQTAAGKKAKPNEIEGRGKGREEDERERERERTLPNKWRSKSSLMVSLLHTKMKPPRGSIRATPAADSLLSLAIPLPPPAAAPPLCFGFN